MSTPDPWADFEARLLTPRDKFAMILDRLDLMMALMEESSLGLTPEERDLILTVRREQAKRDMQPPSADMNAEPPLPRAEATTR